MDTGWVQILISIGSMLVIAGSTTGVLVFQGKELTRRLEAMEKQMERMTQILINQATQQVRLDTMDERLASQGRRLDEAIQLFNTGQTNLGRMVEGLISRMNEFMDSLAKQGLRNYGDGSKLIGSDRG